MGLDALPHIDAIRTGAGKAWDITGFLGAAVGPICTQVYHEAVALLEGIGTLLQNALNMPSSQGVHEYGLLDSDGGRPDGLPTPYTPNQLQHQLKPQHQHQYPVTVNRALAGEVLT
jgi:hypothetical protein